VKRLPSLASLVRLGEVHTLRLAAARRALAQQRNVVANSRRELAERGVKVANLRGQISRTDDYAREQSGPNGPARLAEAASFRRWVHYDLEREVYYLELTEIELSEAEAELARLQREIVRQNARIDAVEGVGATVRGRRAALQERADEDEFEGLARTGNAMHD